MFSVGDKVVYGRTGVCEVESVEEKPSSDGTVRTYYALKPLYQKLNITVAADNPKVFIRPVVTKAEAVELIDSIPGVEAVPFYSQNLTQLKEHYRCSMKNESCSDMMELILSLHRKRSEAEAARRKFGAVDERTMHEAEELLFGELAQALAIEKSEVPGFISSRLGDID